MPRPLKFSQRLDRYPPILVRLLAVRGRGATAWAMTDQQIVQASGLTFAEVKRASYSTNWKELPVWIMQAFLLGCGIDLEKRSTMQRLEFMRLTGTFSHLKRSDLWEPYFRELVEIWADSVK